MDTESAEAEDRENDEGGETSQKFLRGARFGSLIAIFLQLSD
ncbi:hypothetical protein SynMVIR181_01614 [Synechococcus sp. MVIR-18-1]|nr:hypothetical protein SynMVIR181_01614 [Synechococcus sp. MVIR-18-1]